MRSEIETIDQKRPSFIEQARRAQIVECAIETIADLGFAQASLAQIAKRAGVSTGVISYYFAGKDELIREVSAYVFSAGEAFIRYMAAADVCARVKYAKQSVEAAAGEVIRELRAAGAEGGMIALDATGKVVMPYSSETMQRGQVSSQQPAEVIVETQGQAPSPVPSQK